MDRAVKAIESVASVTDRALLFHSASGKDSIALLDLMAPRFKEVVCVYMYIVKGLEHIGRYIAYASGRYPNARFVQIPHFALTSYVRNGYMGCERNEAVRKQTMASLTEMARAQFGADWAFFGFKQSDSMNRRLMLRTYEDECINREQRKCYPLSPYKNKDVIAYIERSGLIAPEKYGTAQSAGTNITDINYLLFLRENWPGDLKRVFAQFPMAERVLFEHDYGKNQGKRDVDN